MMALTKRYDPATAEPRIAQFWHDQGTNHFESGADAPVYSIDTPPPTVSGFLHLGHVYSYSHADFVARFWRMNGYNVYYPMGYDDNGLPTERLVEKQLKRTAEEMGRENFITACLEISREFEQEYETLWKRLGLSIDWRYTYRTIEDNSRKASQSNFLHLLREDKAYRQQAPTIWCPHCHTAIAQAEEKDLDRQSEFVDLAFALENGETLAIATTRPELLPACVAVFVHPDDERYQALVGQQVRVPLFGQLVTVLPDPHADPEKGTGAVMCCTFGDQVDVEWWRTHNLALREGIDAHGNLTAIAGPFAGLSITEGRKAIKETLERDGLLLGRRPVEQSVRVHERCDTPVEYIVTQQWFIRVLDQKDTWQRAGEEIKWWPAPMWARYRDWVENLGWDWCISRQRYYGVPFPIWFCTACGEVIPADESQLPIDPTTAAPPRACSCGSEEFKPELDVMDTWATSSVSPQIAGRQNSEPDIYAQVFPYTLRPQGNEIIRTWAFDTIVMSHHRFGTLPWSNVLISGWGLAPGGTEKISKSRGGGPMAPQTMLERYSADAARYWAGSTSLGKDSIISEEKIQSGAKLVTKLWNVARFCERFLEGYELPAERPTLSPADRWILSRLHRLVRASTTAFQEYEYATAKNETEMFFWGDLSDNYLEMAKKRLYDAENPGHDAARYTLYTVLLTTLKLFAPILPYVTEEIYQGLFLERDGAPSVHRSTWPALDESLIDARADAAGDALVAIATAVRRYKSDNALSLGVELQRVGVHADSPELQHGLTGAEDDIASVTRAITVEIGANLIDLEVLSMDGITRSPLEVGLQR